MMHILNRYIRNTVISATALVVFIFAGVECFAQIMSQLGHLGHHGYTVLTLLLYSFMQVPAIIYMLFPVTAFVGCLIGLGRLASGEELTIMRANGISIAQITWSVIKACLIMLVFVTVIGEWVAPKLQNKAEIMYASALNKPNPMTAQQDVWLHHKDAYIYINDMKNDKTLDGVTEFSFDGKALTTMRSAKRAIKKNHGWQMQNVTTTEISNDHTTVRHEASIPLNINITPSKLRNHESMSLDGSVLQLWHLIKARQSVGLISNIFQFTFWQRIMQPLTTIVMICLGIPFIFGSLRSVPVMVRLVAGVAVGIAFYMLNRFFGPITLIYQFPPVLAALCPTLLFMFIYAYMLRRVS